MTEHRPGHPHHYYVTYTANSPYGQVTGGIEIFMRLPIRSMADVQELGDGISKRKPLDRLSNVVVLGWQRFESES